MTVEDISGSVAALPLAYDVGAYDGADTAHYLSRGYRVVAIEADPTQANRLKQRFAAEIHQGRCVVLNVGIAAKIGTARFYVCDIPGWNSFDPTRARAHGVAVREVEVTCRTFDAILSDYGRPDFLKVDIEGLDHLCVMALTAESSPRFLSFEANDDSSPLILHLISLGFTRFRLVNQRAGWSTVECPEPGSIRHILWSARQALRLGLRKASLLHRVMRAFRDHKWNTVQRAEGESFQLISSGPLPQSIPDKDWSNTSDFLYLWENVRRAGILNSAWFDVHAKR